MTLPLTRTLANEALQRTGLRLPITEHPLNRKTLFQRAARAKKQFETEQQFHQAVREIRSTPDPLRHSYLNWILEHMFSLYNYHSALQVIHDDIAYQKWREMNGL